MQLRPTGTSPGFYQGSPLRQPDQFQEKVFDAFQAGCKQKFEFPAGPWHALMTDPTASGAALGGLAGAQAGCEPSPQVQALGRAMVAIQNVTETLDNCRQVDGVGLMDSDPSPNKVDHEMVSSPIPVEDSVRADLTPGHSSILQHRQLRQQDSPVSSYYLEGPEAKFYGLADERGPVEVMISSNGTFTVFLDSQP